MSETKTITTSTFGVDINIVLPATVEGLNQAAGRDVAYDWAVNYFIAHLHLGQVRKAVVAALAEKTGEERKFHEKDGKKIYDESEGDFVSRVEAMLGPDEFQAIVREAAESVPVDLTKKVRSVGEAKPPAKKYIEMAHALVEAGKFDAFCEKYGIEGADPDNDDDIILVASKVRDVILAAERAAKAEAVKALV